MTGLLRRPIFWLLIGVGSVVLSALFFMMLAAGASLGCVRCNCTYSLFSERSDCRMPAVWALLFNVSLGVTVLSFVAAVILKFRGSRRASDDRDAERLAKSKKL